MTTSIPVAGRLEGCMGKCAGREGSNNSWKMWWGSINGISSCDLSIIYLIYFPRNDDTCITRRSMPFCLISALTISQMRLTAIFSRGVNPVAGSGTSRAGFEPPPNRELSRLPIFNIIISLLHSATVKRTYTLMVGRN